jgi:hypothetical protein
MRGGGRQESWSLIEGVGAKGMWQVTWVWTVGLGDSGVGQAAGPLSQPEPYRFEMSPGMWTR